MKTITLRWSLPWIAGSLLFTPFLARATTTDAHDLSYEEAKSLFSEHFGAEADYAAGSVRLKGFVFKACLQHLEVRKSSSQNRTDFVLRDMGQLKSCVEEQKKLHPNARFGNSQVYARLSEIPTAVILAEGKDLSVGIAWEDTNVDPPKFERLSFPQAIQFVSAATKRNQERQAEKELVDEHLARCESAARNSRGSEEDELEALSAIGILVRNGKLDDSEAEELKLEIGQDRLKRLRERAAKATADQFEEIDEALALWAAQFAADDSSKNDLVAQIRLDLADRMSRENPSSIETQQAALLAAQDVAELSSVSRSKKDQADQRVSTLKGNLVAAQAANSTLALAAMSPIASNSAQLQHTISMQPEFQSLVMTLQREVADACSMATRNSGKDRSSAVRCQRAQAVLATEPQRVLSIAAQAVMKGLQAVAPPVQPQPQPQPQPLPHQPGQGGNTVPYPYSASSQPIPR